MQQVRWIASASSSPNDVPPPKKSRLTLFSRACSNNFLVCSPDKTPACMSTTSTLSVLLSRLFFRCRLLGETHGDNVESTHFNQFLDIGFW